MELIYINVCEGPILESWNSEMFEQPVEQAQTFLHFTAIHPLTLNNKAGWKAYFSFQKTKNFL